MQHLTSKDEEASIGIYRIEYSNSDTKPPVFIAGTFADSEWQPIEMNAIKDESSCEYKFSIKLRIRTGEDHQYKFRIGEGQWWVLNEDEPTVTDDVGNRNNLLQTGLGEGSWKEKVKEGDDVNEVWEERRLTKFIAEERKKFAGVPIETNNSHHLAQQNKALTATESKLDKSENQEIEEKSNKILSEVLTLNPPESSDNNKNAINDGMVSETPAEPSPTPATGNEKLIRSPKTFPLPDGNVTGVLDAVNLGYFSGDTNDKDHMSHDSNTSHEFKTGAEDLVSLSKTKNTENTTDWNPQIDRIHQSLLGFPSWDQATPIDEQVPLLPHECINIPDESCKKSRQNSNVVSADSRPLVLENQTIDDPSVEIFPTDRASILAKILEIQLRLPEDEIRVDQILAPNQTLLQAVGSAQEHPPALVSITEEAESTGSEDSTENKFNPQGELKKKSSQEGYIKSKSKHDKEHPGQKSKSLDSANALSHPENEEEEVPPDNAPESANTEDESKDTSSDLKFHENAKTSGFSEENSRPNLRSSVNRREIRSPERPVTPNSKRSVRKEPPNGNFLKVFWRVIIIEWIGGMLMRFCGRGRRHS